MVKFGFEQHSQANFTWTPINDTCQVLECPALSIPHATLSNTAARTLGQRPKVTCDAGFFVSTEANVTWLPGAAPGCTVEQDTDYQSGGITRNGIPGESATQEHCAEICR